MTESNAEYEMRSWIHQLQGLLSTGVEKQIAEANVILQAAFSYKEETEIVEQTHKPKVEKNYVPLEVPTTGISNTIKQAVLTVQNSDGTTLVDGYAIVVTSTDSSYTRIILTSDMANLITDKVNVKRFDATFSDSDASSDPSPDEIRRKARSFALAGFIAKGHNQNWHISRWNDYCDSLTSVEARKLAFEVYTNRLAELSSSKTDILETTKQIAEDAFNCKCSDMHIHLKRWYDFRNSLSVEERAKAVECYNNHWDKLVCQGVGDTSNISKDRFEDISDKVDQLMDDLGNPESNSDDEYRYMDEWFSFMNGLPVNHRNIAFTMYNKRMKGMR